MFEKKLTLLEQADEFLSNAIVRKETNWSPYKIKVLDEEVKTTMVDNIVSYMFNDVRQKALAVDFAIIDKSKGDVTELRNFDTIERAIYFIKVKGTFRQKDNAEIVRAVNELDYALKTLIKYKSDFKRGFALNDSLSRYLYNSIVIAIIQGSSYLVAETIELMKSMHGYQIRANDQKTLFKNNHIKSISQFNQMERNGQLSKLFKESHNLAENALLNVGKDVAKRLGTLSGVTKWIAVLGLVGFSLTFIRSIIFLYFNSRVKLSQYLLHLKEFVEMNASTIESDGKKVKEKQEKIAQTLGKLSDRIRVDQNVANDRANNQLEDSNRIIALDTKDSDNSTSSLNLY